MAPRPHSPMCSALVNRTNTYSRTTSKTQQTNEKKTIKRSCSRADSRVKKRVKLVSEEEASEDSSSGYDSDSDMEVDNDAMIQARQRRNTTFNIMNTMSIYRPCGFRPSVTTRPILESFVSSHKSDLYKCLSTSANSYLTPPYACSYTNGAKRGETPVLAVATEEGSVHIINTSKRKDWECEQPRFVFQPHDNGIFDVKWNPSDKLLATCSGDQTTRISCPVTGSVLNNLRGHTGTVKCIAWDPNHRDLLSTGGRDGTICIWDLRIVNQETANNEEIIIRPGGPAMVIRNAHGNDIKTKRQRRKVAPLAKSVTSLLYPDGYPYQLISSGSSDGVLHAWDIRFPETNKKASKTPETKQVVPSHTSPFDPTILHSSRRPRGLTSVALGTGRTAGLIFALSAESHVHIYTLPDLMPQKNEYTHELMKSDSFYVKIAISPCGNWLASGSNGTGSMFLFDVSNSACPSWMRSQHGSEGVELRGQNGEVGAVDWAERSLASCSDHGTVKIWRPDIDVYRDCLEAPEEKKWEWTWSKEYNDQRIGGVRT